ncbi:MAG: hypothetical protein QG646_1282 [Euryarchaeota archaeon]|nr:hypothetical protein [Euryarchaeota archaeon]
MINIILVQKDKVIGVYIVTQKKRLDRVNKEIWTNETK